MDNIDLVSPFSFSKINHKIIIFEHPNDDQQCSSAFPELTEEVG